MNPPMSTPISQPRCTALAERGCRRNQMSRVERIEDWNQRPTQSRQRQPAHVNRRTDAPGRTPGKAEREERDVEEALEQQHE
jgi:hypothetical protein